MAEFFSLLKKSYLLFAKNPLKSIKLVGIDLVTFLVFLLIAGSFQSKMIDEIISINNLVTSRLGGLTEASAGKVSQALSGFPLDSFSQHYINFMVYLLLMILSSLFVYIIFQHYAWFKSNLIVLKKRKISFKELKKYFLNFAVISFLWVLIFLISMAVYIKISLASVFFTGPGAYGNATKWFIISAFFIAFYFSFAGYSVSLKQKLPKLIWGHVVEGVKKSKFYLPLFLLFIIKSYIVIKILSILFLHKPHIMVPLTSVLIIPLFTWLRYSFIVCKK